MTAPMAAPLTHGHSAADACSVEWDRADDETLYGTAAPARFWVAVEQNGPWGSDAATESFLPSALGADLTARCRQAGGRLSLIRRPGAHAAPRTGPRWCYLAWAGPRPFLLAAAVDAADDLLDLPLEALARGDLSGVLGSAPHFAPADPVFLVCTNGRRDVCCAVRGRPVALAGHERHPGQAWECSHTGGHRFSPTGVLLPWGRTLGRVDPQGVAELLDHALTGHLPTRLLGPRHDRGSSAYAPQEQVGESHVRHLIGETDLEALRAEATGPLEVTVEHLDGRRWAVRLSVVTGAARRNSCGETAEPARTWSATARRLPPA